MGADTKTVDVGVLTVLDYLLRLKGPRALTNSTWQELSYVRAAIEDFRLKADNAERALRSLVAAGQAPAGYLQYADDLAAALRAVGGAE